MATFFKNNIKCCCLTSYSFIEWTETEENNGVGSKDQQMKD